MRRLFSARAEKAADGDHFKGAPQAFVYKISATGGFASAAGM
jgi:hypothetical protein